jgi:PAS domain S-box-containing protein
MTKTSKEIRMMQYLSRRLLPLATGIGLLLALLGPLTYWFIEHRSLHHITNLYAEELAEEFQRIALESPSLWKYQTYKFNSLIDGFHPAIDVLGFSILDEQGVSISGYEYKKGWDKHGRELTFAEEFKVTLGTAPLIFNNRQIGSVEVLVSDARLQRACANLFCISALVGTALALLVYLFPVRVARKMEREIEELLSTVQQSEDRYRSLVEMSLVGVYIIVDGIFRYVNPKFTEIFGWSFEELTGKKGPVDLTLPDDWPTVEQNLRKRVSGEITSIDYEFRGVTKDNRVIFLEVFGCRTTYQGQPAMIGTLLDISKRKRAEEASRSAAEFSQIVMDSIDDAISILDVSDYRIMGCNAGFLKVFGLTMEEVVGKKCFELTHNQPEPCSPPLDICPMKETVTTGNYSVAEHIHFRENGDKFYAEVSTSPILDGNGKVVRVVHVSRDITERKRAEEKISRLNEELELKVEEKTMKLLDAQDELVRKEKLATLGQLSGSVGHELRNPLGVMSNAIYFLKMVLTDADEITKEYLDIIKQEIETSQRIISDLLDFARTKPPQTKTVTAIELVEQSIGRCTIPGCITLLSEVPETLPRLRVDPLQMGQVLQNLITNGIQAMPSGGVLRIAAHRVLSSEFGVLSSNLKAETLGTKSGEDVALASEFKSLGSNPELKTQNLKLDGDFIEISVTDRGEGIPEENMRKIFQPLFTTKAKGIGLGLVVCRNLVESNGGRIEVESKPGEGTTFMVMLPVEGE